MKRTRLVTPQYAVGIHGQTGQDVDGGWLAPGTLVRAIRQDADQEGQPIWYFQASTDGGRTWYRQRSTAPLETAAR